MLRRRSGCRQRSKRLLLHEIAAEAREVRPFLRDGRIDAWVIEALAAVPREEFIPPEARERAYANVPLSIGRGQTISQPFIVALMTDLARPRPGDVVLETGCGSGYQAAVLSRLVRSVYSVEILGSLAVAAKERLTRLGCRNVEVRHADGYDGWPEHAPYDAVVVSAAAPSIPPPLVEQLSEDGRLVIPLCTSGSSQELVVVRRKPRGGVDIQPVLPVAFVPLTRGARD